jgi:8-oxo-dGTP pyrophosphatase MutT (NUDIX family)
VVPVRDAATLVLVRDAGGAGIEVFLLRRNPAAAFAPAASVFPGGAVDDADATVPIVGRRDDECDRLLDRPAARRCFAAAVREAFEEAGFLLTVPPAPADVEAARRALNAGTTDFASVLAAHDLAVDAGALHVFAHWLTPVGAPRRYDTWFFVAAAPPEQQGTHDDSEAVHSEWRTPRAALDAARAGDIELIEPTWHTLRALARWSSTAALLDALRAAEDESRVSGRPPRVVRETQGERIAMPTEVSQTRGWHDLGRHEGAA